MAKPSPWKYRGWWVTSSAGKFREKLCPATHPKKDAEKVLLQRLAQADSNEGPTVEEAIDRYLSAQRGEVCDLTLANYTSKLAKLKKRFGPNLLSSLTEEDGKTLKGSLKGLKPGMVNAVMRVASNFLNWCCKPSQGLLESNPWRAIKRVTEKGRERTMTEEEFQSLLREAMNVPKMATPVKGGPEDFCLQLTLLRLTTMRPGELRALRWEHISWAKHRIVFPREVIKTRSRRVVTLTDEAKAILLKKGPKEEGYVFTKNARVNGALVAGASNQPISADLLSRRFRKLADRCAAKGLIQGVKQGEKLVPYTNRHTAITRLIEKGVPLKFVMDEAGHTSPKTTMRYVHNSEDIVNESVRKALDPAKEP